MKLPREITIKGIDLIEGETLQSTGEVRFTVTYKGGKKVLLYCTAMDVLCILTACQVIKRDLARTWTNIKSAFQRGVDGD